MKNVEVGSFGIKNVTTKQLTMVAILIALNVVLSRFLSIPAWNVKIGFSFVPVVMAGMLMGPAFGFLVGACGDFVGAILFPFGAFFPGYTLTAGLTGMIYGLCLYKKQSLLRIVVASFAVEIFCSLLLNSYWITLTAGTPFLSLLPVRISKVFIMSAVKVVTISCMVKYFPKINFLDRVSS
ncbi:MAG: folate family ECF transporter S component [Bacillota bacterium]